MHAYADWSHVMLRKTFGLMKIYPSPSRMNN